MQHLYNVRIPIPEQLVICESSLGVWPGQARHVANALNILASERLLDRFRVSWYPPASHGVTHADNPYLSHIPQLRLQDLGMDLAEILVDPLRYLDTHLPPHAQYQVSRLGKLPSAA